MKKLTNQAKWASILAVVLYGTYSCNEFKTDALINQAKDDIQTLRADPKDYPDGALLKYTWNLTGEDLYVRIKYNQKTQQWDVVEVLP